MSLRPLTFLFLDEKGARPEAFVFDAQLSPRPAPLMMIVVGLPFARMNGFDARPFLFCLSNTALVIVLESLSKCKTSSFLNG